MANDRLQRVIDGLAPVNHWDGSFVVTDFIDIVGNDHAASSAATEQITSGTDYNHLPAISFNGSINGADVLNDVNICVGESALAFSITFKLDDTTSSKAFFSRYLDSTHLMRVYFEQDGVDDYLNIFFKDGSITPYGFRVQDFPTLYNAAIGDETTLTVSIDFAAGTAIITIDGKQVAHSVYNIIPATAPNLTGAGTEFGYMVSAQFGTDMGFAGDMDEILFFDKALSITDHFNIFVASRALGKRILTIGDEVNMLGGDSRAPTGVENSFIYKPDTFPATSHALKHLDDTLSAPYPEIAYEFAKVIETSFETNILIEGAVNDSTLKGDSSTSWNYRNPNDHFDRTTVYGAALSNVLDLYDRIDAILLHVGINDALNDYRDEDSFLSDLRTLHDRIEEDLGYEVPIFIDYLDEIESGSTDESCQAIRKAALRFVNPAERRHLTKAYPQYSKSDGIHFDQNAQDTRGFDISRIVLGRLGIVDYSKWRVPTLEAERKSGKTRDIKIISFDGHDANNVYTEVYGRNGDGSWEGAISAQYLDDRLARFTFNNSVTELRGPFYGAVPAINAAVTMADDTGYYGFTPSMGNIIMVDEVISRPDDYPMFSAFDKKDATSGQYNVAAIPDVYREYGFTRYQKPPRQFFNKLFRNIYHWIRYLDQLSLTFDESQYEVVQFNVVNGAQNLDLRYRNVFDSTFLRLSISQGSFSGSAFQLAPVSGEWPSEMIPTSPQYLRCTVINDGIRRIGILKIPNNVSSNFELSWLDTSISSSLDQFNTTFSTSVGVLPELFRYYRYL